MYNRLDKSALMVYSSVHFSPDSLSQLQWSLGICMAHCILLPGRGIVDLHAAIEV